LDVGIVSSGNIVDLFNYFCFDGEDGGAIIDGVGCVMVGSGSYSAATRYQPHIVCGSENLLEFLSCLIHIGQGMSLFDCLGKEASRLCSHQRLVQHLLLGVGRFVDE